MEKCKNEIDIDENRLYRLNYLYAMFFFQSLSFDKEVVIYQNTF